MGELQGAGAPRTGTRVREELGALGREGGSQAPWEMAGRAALSKEKQSAQAGSSTAAGEKLNRTHSAGRKRGAAQMGSTICSAPSFTAHRSG